MAKRWLSRLLFLSFWWALLAFLSLEGNPLCWPWWARLSGACVVLLMAALIVWKKAASASEQAAVTRELAIAVRESDGDYTDCESYMDRRTFAAFLSWVECIRRHDG